jgi:hypothetical protein
MKSGPSAPDAVSEHDVAGLSGIVVTERRMRADRRWRRRRGERIIVATGDADRERS